MKELFIKKLVLIRLDHISKSADYHYDNWMKYCHDGLGIYEGKPYAGIIRWYCKKKAAYHMKKYIKYHNKIMFVAHIFKIKN